MSNDLRLAQLLCSRLCHDLVGPAGAVNAGLELAEEGEMDGDALELVTSSAAEVTRRLAFFRIAFGAAGGKASAVGTLSAAAMRAASLKVSTILPVFVAVSWRHFSTPNSAESMRMTPRLRTSRPASSKDGQPE